MNNNLKNCLFVSVLFISCTSNVETEVTSGCDFDGAPSLQFYEPIKEININNNIFPQYDSIYLDVFLYVEIITEGDRTDSIMVKSPSWYSDTQSYNSIIVMAKNPKGGDDIPLCWMNEYVMMDSLTTEEYRDILMELDKTIMNEVEKKYFYMAEKDYSAIPDLIRRRDQYIRFVVPIHRI